jgi:hypothetical protein
VDQIDDNHMKKHGYTTYDYFVGKRNCTLNSPCVWLMSHSHSRICDVMLQIHFLQQDFSGASGGGG